MIGVFDHPWLGSLFGDETMAEIWSPDRTMKHMLHFEAEYARVLGLCGSVDKNAAEKATGIIEGFTPDVETLKATTKRDGVVIPGLIEQIKSAMKEELLITVHHGATSQDVIDTALSLTIKETLDYLDESLMSLGENLQSLITRFGENTLVGRTRMQAALPIKSADRIATWALPMTEHRQRIEELRPRVQLLHLGGAVGNNAALDDMAGSILEHMGNRLQLNVPLKAGHAMRSGLVEFANVLALISGSLGKMGQDVCLMAQQGIDEIALEGGGASSAMPHKQNPITAELLVTLARFNATQIAGMHQSLISEQERSGSAWMLEWMILPQMAMATARSITAAQSLSDQVKIIGGSPD